MTFINFKIGERLEIEGEVWKFVGRTTDGMSNLLHEQDNRFDERSDNELHGLWQLRRMKRLPPKDKDLHPLDREFVQRDIATYPQHLTAKAIRRFEYVIDVHNAQLKHHSARWVEPVIKQTAERIGDANPPSARRVAEWMRLASRGGTPDIQDVRYLAPRFHMRGNRDRRFDPEVAREMDRLIEDHWLVPTPETVVALHRDLQVFCKLLETKGRQAKHLTADGSEVKCPSLRTMYERVNSIPRDEVIGAQKGARIARNDCAPSIRGPQGEFPLSEVEIDHHLGGVRLINLERQTVIGRPWFSVALCRYTRAIAGLGISFRPPCVYSVQLLLKQIAESKDAVIAPYSDIRNRWEVHGIPRTIVLDNGPEMHARSLVEAAKSLGITIQYCEAFRPQQKGKIERFFWTMEEQLIQCLPGATKSNPEARGDYDSDDEAVMTLSDLKGSVYRWLVDEYMQNAHSALGMSPAQAWERGNRKHPVRLPDSVEQLDCLIGCIEYRSLSIKGIELYGLRYSSKDAAFRKLVNRPDKPPLVKLKVNIEDLSSIMLEDWKTGKWHEVPSIYPEYTTGLTLAEHDMIRARVRERLKAHKRATLADMVAARRDLRIKIQELKRLKKLANKRMVAVDGKEEHALPHAPHDFSQGALANGTVPINGAPEWTGAKPPLVVGPTEPESSGNQPPRKADTSDMVFED
jgi:putative transposase